MNSPIGGMALSGPHKTVSCHMPLGRQPQRYFQTSTTTAARAPSCHPLAGAALVPHASSGRTSSGSSSKPQQRSFSVMQSAMKIPGLASALHLIGVNSPNGASASGTDSTVAAAGGSGTNSGGMPGPEEPPSPRTANPQPEPPQPHPQQQQHGPLQDQLAGGGGDGDRASPATASTASSAAEVLYDLAAAAVAAANGNGNGNGHLPHQQELNQQQQQLAAVQPQGARHINSYANGVAHRRESTEEILGSLDPSGSRTENNIMPYTGYLEKIEEQEFELAAKDQVLRSKEERIKSLEQESTELRKSLALLHSAKVAAEAEVQRLRAAAAISRPASTPALGTAAAVAAAAAPAAADSEAPPVPSAAAPHTLPSPPPAIAASAPALVTPAATSSPTPAPQNQQAPTPAATAAAPAAATSVPPVSAPAATAAATSAATSVPPVPAPAATLAPPPTTPPLPPPPRVPEIVLLYRSSWPEAFLHCNVEGRGWTAVPGLRMEHAGAKEYAVRLPGRSVEFVLTNGHGEWDSPGVGGIGRNYHIDTPGEYRLHYGVLAQVKAWQP
ncbi:hypothetical protein VOLCADRAFT_108148 [Volvox carteri f. nagariensis]|uniref:Carbohydrate binding module family 25 domain-containing protein n=1 Tax=Volvox carteri f. nagariensis TaxID=3068 RepID=D8UIJ7_VOLCA|nr:uncharacterized protein VOLCADRAFT_108148 [Volvox carteri f. nagariensis]EFJ40466.1 hypothetical protein VOLCADRAFT_108148 [Volvox carteri f. nagariensis]|eukprot:XP_002958466.1 hypothetical protein VOLCADRAFT_108148 [Volvox carteri f. nagariensis]